MSESSSGRAASTNRVAACRFGSFHALHFPAGGRRFRPTLEEFLLFLDRENLFNDWKDGWKPKLIRSLEAWERLQARATVRQFPEEAVGALEALGYSVTEPTGGDSG